MSVLVVIFIVVIGIWLVGKLTGLLIGLLLAGIAGYFASRLLGGDGVGAVGNVILGVGGGLIGPFILNALNVGGLASIPLIGVILSSIVGAVVIIFIVRLFNQNFAK
ncbi:MAG: GlsB/YeaQ/YmgE family stress response membrane protein [Anaerolineae bacterium]|jgi:uncharacterized membrane protein YeaQ/YmgE (transglycosylase-associated protein family)|nr:GlsB/YeaQ/YmgE family stress response membrane protein [Anaerolineae bacterium]